MYNYAILFTTAKSSLKTREAMVEDVAAMAVVSEVVGTYPVSASAPAAARALASCPDHSPNKQG